MIRDCIDSWSLLSSLLSSCEAHALLVFRQGGCALNVILSLTKSEGFLVVVRKTSTEMMDRSAQEIYLSLQTSL